MKSTKELVLERIGQQIDEQTAKGAVKYNKPLEDCGLDDYNWQSMQIEELIDGSRYQHMENMRLKKKLNVKTESNRKLREEIYKLENTGVALYELKLLHKKVNPTENSNVDRHFKTVIELLENGEVNGINKPSNPPRIPTKPGTSGTPRIQ